MATLMEKDVLLEMISYSLANLHRKEIPQKDKVESFLCKMKLNFLSSNPEAIDYKAALLKLKEIEAM